MSFVMEETQNTIKQRTDRQNRALHLYFEHLAQELNDAGLDMRKTLKPTIDIPWNKDTVKEYLWRPIMKTQLGIRSTTQMTTKDIDAVLNTITRHIGEKFGLTIEFPSIESLTWEEEHQKA